jgi:prepilin-type N-terminal cleavage/methylation domain-containing protein
VRRSEYGFTLIEVMVAMVISVTVAGATLALVSTGTKSSLAGQRQTQLLSVAQQQIEQIRQTARQYGFDSLALNGSSTSYPAPDATTPVTPANASDFITGYGTSGAALQVKANYHDPTSGTLVSETIVFDSTSGRVQPYSTGVPAGGGATATVWRFVTQRAEACNAGLGACTGDSRRIVVAVNMDNPTGDQNIGPNTPIYMTTVIDRPLPSNSTSQGNGLRIGVQIQ